MTATDAALPLTVLGGYLGSGKTTLVNHLLRNADGLRLAVLVNEFGDLPIDADLIEAEGDDIISIAGGCVCCSFGNDLTAALIDLAKMEPRPDHVLLEASGVALPGAIAASVSLLGSYAMDGVVVVVDAETVRKQACDTFIGDTITRQLADADLVLINKTDLVDNDALADLDTWIAENAPSAQSLHCRHGVVTPAAVLASFLERDRGSPHHHHPEASQFETITLAVDQTVDAAKLADGLAKLEPGLVRAKGFVCSADGTIMAIQLVGRRCSVSPATKSVACGLVVIGRKGSVDKGRLEELVRDAEFVNNVLIPEF